MRKFITAAAFGVLSLTALSACSKPEAEQAVEEVQEAATELAADTGAAMSSAASDFATSDPIAYDCALGTKLSVVYSDKTAEVTILSANNQTVTLTETASASGTLYQAPGYSLHTKGDDALWSSKDEACTKA